MVEQQPVLAPFGEIVQSGPHFPQEIAAAYQRAVLGFAQETMPDQVVQGGSVEVALRHPRDHLDVAQAARTFLDVRFEVIGGIVETAVTFNLLFPLGGKEFLARP